MIHQLGMPTWFFTLSAADMKWPDMIQNIAIQYGITFTDDKVSALSFEDNCKTQLLHLALSSVLTSNFDLQLLQV